MTDSVYITRLLARKQANLLEINVHLKQSLAKAVGLECAPAPTHCLHAPLEMKYLVLVTADYLKVLVSKEAETVTALII